MMKRVTAAILVDDGRVLITKRKSTDRFPNKWEFPGGTIEDGETPEKCLQRELKEELDIDAIIGDYVGESIYPYEHVTISLLAYRAFWNHGDINLKVHTDFAWVTLNEIGDYDFTPADIPFVDRIRRGEIEL
jgi:8-oxo-dGTP diphosphatase